MRLLLLDVMTWVLVLLGAATLGRLVAGPSTQDRLVALSVLSGLVLATLVVLGVRQGRSLYLDVALLYDIFGFLGLLAAAYFMKKRTGGGP